MKTAVAVLMLSFFAVTSYAQKKKAPLQEVVFSVNLHCENCVKKVQENIPEKLAAAIEKLGYEVLGEVKQE